MKFRADDTISERQLVLAMADAGRPVSLAALAIWRRDGLLPPLTSHGLGPGKGKSYYWREKDVVAQACAAFDFLAKYGRPDAAIWMLWLCGFAVPLPQLRRAWRSRSKMRKPWAVRPAHPAPKDRHDERYGFEEKRCDPVSAALMQAALILSDGILPGISRENTVIARILSLALLRVTRANHPVSNEDMAARSWGLVQILGSVLESSNLISDACDDDMHEAQRYLCIAARLLQGCAANFRIGVSGSGPAPWSSALAEQLGPPIFLLILVLLQSGQRALLDDIARDIEEPGRREVFSPAPILRHHA